jgi:hypothetical protein
MKHQSSSPDSEGLLPCPFCGSAPVTERTGFSGRAMYIYCINDNGCPRPKAIGETVEKAIENWNLRSPVEAARAPYAWAVERPTDPTFPRVCWTKEVADALVQHVNVAPPATVMPLYVGAAQGKPGPFRWRHKKRGSTYVEIGRGNLQIATDPVEEDDRVVIYQSEADGRLWVRGESEFQDGRFEALPMTSTNRGSTDNG